MNKRKKFIGIYTCRCIAYRLRCDWHNGIDITYSLARLYSLFTNYALCPLYIYREAYIKAEEAELKEQTKRMTVDDFEPLAIIGRGAFGEVYTLYIYINIIHMLGYILHALYTIILYIYI